MAELNGRSLGVTAVALCMSGLLALAGESQSEKFFPLREGAAWTYEGVVRWWADRSTPDMAERRVRWRVEVVRHVKRGAIEVAVMRGSPLDALEAYGFDEPKGTRERGPTPSTWYLIRFGPRFHEVSGVELDKPALIDAIGRWLRGPGSDAELIEALREQEVKLLFELPLNAEDATEKAGAWQWSLMTVKKRQLSGIRGVPGGMATVYELGYGWNSGKHEIQVVDSVGIVRETYRYHPASYRASTEMDLVAFEPGR